MYLQVAKIQVFMTQLGWRTDPELQFQDWKKQEELEDWTETWKWMKLHL